MTIDELKRFRQLGSKTRGPSRVVPCRRHRDDDRPARPGPRHRRRHGAGRAHPERPLRRRSGRSLHLCHRQRRLPDGRHQPRGHPLAGHLGLAKLIVLFDDNEHLHRRPDQPRCRPTTTLNRFQAAGWDVRAIDGHDPQQIARRASKRARTTDAPVADRLQDHHRLWRADQGRHRSTATARRSGADEITAPARSWAGPHQPFVIPERITASGAASASAASRQRESWEAPPERRWRQRPRRVRSRAMRRPAARFRRADRRASRPRSRPRSRSWRPASHPASAGRADPPRCPRLIGGSADLTGPQQHQDQGHERRSTRDDFDGPLCPFRRARARHGRGDERHGAAWRHHPLWRHVPGLHRLLPPGDPPGGADGQPRDLRHDP